MAAGGSVYEAWEERRGVEERRRLAAAAAAAGKAKGGGVEGQVEEEEEEEYVGKGKGKSKDSSRRVRREEEEGGERGEGTQEPREGLGDGVVSPAKRDQQPALGPLVLLACRHIYHQSCLEALLEKDEEGKVGEYRCPIDG